MKTYSSFKDKEMDEEGVINITKPSKFNLPC